MVQKVARKKEHTLWLDIFGVLIRFAKRKLALEVMSVRKQEFEFFLFRRKNKTLHQKYLMLNLTKVE